MERERKKNSVAGTFTVALLPSVQLHLEILIVRITLPVEGPPTRILLAKNTPGMKIAAKIGASCSDKMRTWHCHASGMKGRSLEFLVEYLELEA